MMPLAERLRILELQMSPHSMHGGDKPALLSGFIDQISDIVSVASERKSYQILGKIDELSAKLASRCITLIDSHPELVTRAIKNCRVEAEDAKELISTIYKLNAMARHHDLVDALVENIINYETYFSLARPQIARDLIESFIRYTDRPAPIIRLCSVIADTNTKDVAGAGFVVSALKSADRFNVQAVEEAIRFTGHVTGYVDRTRVIEAISHWVKASEVTIAESIKAGSPSEWASISAIEAAESMELPLIAANLLTRMDMFAYPKLAALAKDSGFHTDEKHIEKVLNTHDSSDTGQRASVIAYCLLYRDILPDSIFSGDYPAAFARAAGIMGEEPLHPVHGKALLERMVDKLRPDDDIWPLMKTRLHADLTSFRKYRGMTLENELGM